MTTSEQTLKAILDRLVSIEKKVDHMNNPLAHVSIKEKGEMLGAAIRSGDKARIKAAKRAINDRSLQ